MRHRVLLVMLAVTLAALPALAQETPRSARSAKKAHAARAAVVAPYTVQKHLAAVDTLRNYDPAAQAVTWFWNVEAPDSGFVHGTNWFEDRAKATALALPDGVSQAQVTEVSVWFGYKRNGLTTQTYAIEILDGTPDTGPTTLLESQEFLMADVNADEDTGNISRTRHVLTEPVTVGASFFVSVFFGSYGQADWGNVAIVASDFLGVRVEEDWEQWRDDSWNLISDAWFSGDNDGWYLWIEAVVDTDVGTAAEDAGELPRAFALVQNFPNPFRTTTTLRVELPTRTEVALHVVDLLGRTVATLAQGPMEAGIHRVRFEAETLPPGIYLARLHTGSETLTRKMILIR